MTPLEIETLIKVYVQPCEKLNKLGIRQIAAKGLVRPDSSSPPNDGLERHGYAVTRKGAAMIDALTNLPIPTMRTFWVTEFEHFIDEKNL